MIIYFTRENEPLCKCNTHFYKQAIDDTSTVAKQWVKLGDYFNSIDELSQAERCFMKGSNPKKAVEMYTEKGSDNHIMNSSN